MAAPVASDSQSGRGKYCRCRDLFLPASYRYSPWANTPLLRMERPTFSDVEPIIASPCDGCQATSGVRRIPVRGAPAFAGRDEAQPRGGVPQLLDRQFKRLGGTSLDKLKTVLVPAPPARVGMGRPTCGPAPGIERTAGPMPGRVSRRGCPRLSLGLRLPKSPCGASLGRCSRECARSRARHTWSAGASCRCPGP